MKRALLFAIPILFFVGCSSAQPTTGKLPKDQAILKDLHALQGAWKLTSRKENGSETATDIKDRVITFEMENYSINDGDELIAEATFNIDPTKHPKWFDLTITNEGHPNKGKRQLGIFKIEGDKLTFCIGTFNGARPASFTALPNSNRVLTTYEKVKK